MENQKISELQRAHEAAVFAAEEAHQKLSTALIDHEKYK